MTSETFKMAAPMLFHSDEEANAAINALEIEDGVSFVVCKSKFTGISRKCPVNLFTLLLL